MPVALNPAPAARGLKYIPVGSATRPGLSHRVTVNKATLTATACDCESGRRCRACWHEADTQAKLDAMRHIKANVSEWPDTHIEKYHPCPCTQCGGAAFVVQVYVNRSEAGHCGYLWPLVCPKCGIVRRNTL